MRIYGRGCNFHRKSLNILGQILSAPTGHHLPHFTLLPFPASCSFQSLDCHFTQSVCLTSDNQILQWGWTMDQLTSTRTLKYYKTYPGVYIQLQKWVPGIWGMRSYMHQPNLMNRSLLDKSRVKKVVMGASFMLAVDGISFAYQTMGSYLLWAIIMEVNQDQEIFNTNQTLNQSY